MTKLCFHANDAPTLGVEIELQLVHAETLALSNSVQDVLERVPPELAHRVKPELMQSYVEINTEICRTVAEVGDDLRTKLEVVERITDALGLKLHWGGTHPFSSWRDQLITPSERYEHLVKLMQDVARQLVTFGLHVHVGVDSGDKAVMICDRLLRYLPLLLALSSNSPFWEGRATGLRSNRSIVMDGLPTAGLPHRMRNWSEYVWLINHLVETGFINTIREIWWDLRPHHNFGTVEIRVCDMPPCLDHVLALTALVQCLVEAISDEIDSGAWQSDSHAMMVQQNKWRATRFGVEAKLVNHDDFQLYTVEEEIDRLIGLLQPTAAKLGCVDELHAIKTLPESNGAKRQLEIYERTGSREAVVREMLEKGGWRRS